MGRSTTSVATAAVELVRSVCWVVHEEPIREARRRDHPWDGCVPLMREGDLLDGRFRIGREAGVGGSGVVHAARDERTGEAVAVKVLTATEPTDVARFAREVDLLVALQHPGVVRYVAHGRIPEGAPWLAMELLAGETLKARSQRAPLSAAEAIGVGVAVANALAGAHAQGIVHRDVKPANVFLSGSAVAQVKLLDFGVARLRRWNGKTAAQLTHAGASISTPAYMSPEQARGDDDVGPPSDVFSLGVVLYELAAGERPFKSPDIIDFLLELTRERAPSVAPRATHFPARFAELVDAMLDPLPQRRPRMADVASRLESLRAASTPNASGLDAASVPAKVTLVDLPAQAPRPTVAAPKRGVPFAVLAGVGLVVGVGVGVGAAIATRSPRPPDRAQNSPRPSSSPTPSPGPTPSSSPPRTAVAPLASAPMDPLSCPPAAWTRCEPAPAGAPSDVDPSDLVAACLAAARKQDPLARLTRVRSSGLRNGKVDLTEPASCGLVSGDWHYMSLQVTPKMVGVLAIAEPMLMSSFSATVIPDVPCPFAKAWVVARPLLGGETAGVEYILAADENTPKPIPFWIVSSERHIIRIDARTCVLSTSVDPR